MAGKKRTKKAVPSPQNLEDLVPLDNIAYLPKTTAPRIRKSNKAKVVCHKCKTVFETEDFFGIECLYSCSRCGN